MIYEKYIIQVNSNKYYVCKADSPFDEQKLIVTNHKEEARKFSNQKDAKIYCYKLRKYINEKFKFEVKKYSKK